MFQVIVMLPALLASLVANVAIDGPKHLEDLGTGKTPVVRGYMNISMPSMIVGAEMEVTNMPPGFTTNTIADEDIENIFSDWDVRVEESTRLDSDLKEQYGVDDGVVYKVGRPNTLVWGLVVVLEDHENDMLYVLASIEEAHDFEMFNYWIKLVMEDGVLGAQDPPGYDRFEPWPDKDYDRQESGAVQYTTA